MPVTLRTSTYQVRRVLNTGRPIDPIPNAFRLDQFLPPKSQKSHHKPLWPLSSLGAWGFKHLFRSRYCYRDGQAPVFFSIRVRVFPRSYYEDNDVKQGVIQAK